MRPGALLAIVAASMIGCVVPLPRERPADFSVAVSRSAMTAPTPLDRWRLDAQGWTFDVASGRPEITGPAAPGELDQAYKLVRDARMDLYVTEAIEGAVIMDGHVEMVELMIAGRRTKVITGTRYAHVRGDRQNYANAMTGLAALATAAYARVAPQGSMP